MVEKAIVTSHSLDDGASAEGLQRLNPRLDTTIQHAMKALCADRYPRRRKECCLKNESAQNIA